jgi:hypothetical protein
MEIIIACFYIENNPVEGNVASFKEERRKRTVQAKVL